MTQKEEGRSCTLYIQNYSVFIANSPVTVYYWVPSRPKLSLIQYIVILTEQRPERSLKYLPTRHHRINAPLQPYQGARGHLVTATNTLDFGVQRIK